MIKHSVISARFFVQVVHRSPISFTYWRAIHKLIDPAYRCASSLRAFKTGAVGRRKKDQTFFFVFMAVRFFVFNQ